MWIKRKDTPKAVWEYIVDGQLLLTLAYEGITDSADATNVRDFLWALYDERPGKGRHRWTYKDSEKTIDEMKAAGEVLLKPADPKPCDHGGKDRNGCSRSYQMREVSKECYCPKCKETVPLPRSLWAVRVLPEDGTRRARAEAAAKEIAKDKEMHPSGSRRLSVGEIANIIMVHTGGGE